MEIFNLLEIEDLSEFKYFDQFAQLTETTEDIPYECIYHIFEQLEPGLLSELVDDYFSDIIRGVPESEEELYVLLDNIRRALKGLSENMEEDNNCVKLTDEYYKFRNWYNFNTDVICVNRKNGEKTIVPVRDALVMYRVEKLSGDEYSYDFYDCVDYEIDEYVVSFTSGDMEEDYDYSTGNEEEALLNSDYLYDDEYFDAESDY